MDEPQSSIYGGATAAPVFQRTVERWLPTMPEIKRSNRLADAGTELDSLAARPDVSDLPEAVANRMQSVLGYAQRSSGFPQRPKPASIPLDSLATIPDVVGMGARDASYVLAVAGIAARFEGSGKVVSQFPRAGSAPEKEVVLKMK